MQGLSEGDLSVELALAAWSRTRRLAGPPKPDELSQLGREGRT
jgi:hypothetical protein